MHAASIQPSVFGCSAAPGSGPGAEQMQKHDSRATTGVPRRANLTKTTESAFWILGLLSLNCM